MVNCVWSKLIAFYFFALQTLNRECHAGVVSHRSLRFFADLKPSHEIAYTIDHSLASSNGDSSPRTCIHEAIEHLQRYTCLKFVKLNPEIIAEQNRSFTLLFKNIKNNNNSLRHEHINHGPRLGVNEVNLGQLPGVAEVVSCLRLILQQFGVGYEHQRFDRNDFIRVDMAHVKQADRPLYHSVLHLDEFEVVTPYDISSVMHYGSKESSLTGQHTIITSVSPIMQHSVGAEIRGKELPLSSRDITTINRVFRCTDRCSRDLGCMHGSYPSLDCTHCICQYGFSGRFCDKLQMASHFNVEGCGLVNGSSGSITSPDYPEQYPRGMFCQWLIEGKSRSERIVFTIHSLDLEHEMVIRSDRCMDTFYVWPHGTDVLTKSLSCFPDDARAVSGRWHTTQSNWLLIELRTSPWGDARHTGFNISYDTIDLQTKVTPKTSMRDSKLKCASDLHADTQSSRSLRCYACRGNASCSSPVKEIVTCDLLHVCGKMTSQEGFVEWRGCRRLNSCDEVYTKCAKARNGQRRSITCCATHLCNDAQLSKLFGSFLSTIVLLTMILYMAAYGSH